VLLSRQGCQCCRFGDLLLKTPYLKLAELARAADHTSVRREPQSLKRIGDVVSSRADPVNAAFRSMRITPKPGAGGGCGRSSAISRKISWNICRGMATSAILKCDVATVAHHLRTDQREALDCHAFTSNRREECAQMPGKMARSAPPTTVRAARCAGGRPHLAAVLQEGRKSANICTSSGAIRGIPVKSFSLTSASARPYDLDRFHPVLPTGQTVPQ
jgi:hypothetical protein